MEPEMMSGFSLSPCAAAQLSYHVRMAAVFAVAGESDESASEAVLAWTMLATCSPVAVSAAAATASELIDQDQVALSEAARSAARDRAHALALALESHFVSCGQSEEAALYASVADELETTVATLAATTRP